MSFRILVADESHPIRRLVCRFLEAVGVGRPTEADSVEATLAELQANSFELAIVDVFMGDSNPIGIELIAAIRTIQPGIKLVVMTTNAEEALIQAALDAGASEYLIKPFGLAERQRLLELCQQERPRSLSVTE